jgi:hypothetical protein
LLLQDSLKSSQFYHAHSLPAPNSPCPEAQPADKDACQIDRRLASWPVERRAWEASAQPTDACAARSSQWHFQEWPQPVFKMQTDVLEDDATSAWLPPPRSNTAGGN